MPKGTTITAAALGLTEAKCDDCGKAADPRLLYGIRDGVTVVEDPDFFVCDPCFYHSSGAPSTNALIARAGQVR